MNIFNLIVIKGVDHLDIDNMFISIDMICLKVGKICDEK